MLWFGIKNEVEKLNEEVKQLKCKHPAEDNIFTEERYCVFGMCGTHGERKCSRCGAVLEAFGSELAMQISKGEWHKKEAERLDIDKLLGTGYLHKKMGEKCLSDALARESKNTEANVDGARENSPLHKANYPGVILRAQEKREKDRIVCDGDYIKKIKGRWVNERTGKVLKVKK